MKLLGNLLKSFLCAALCLGLALGCGAAGETGVVQAYTDSGAANLFITGAQSSGDVACRVSNQECVLSGYGLLRDQDIPVHTMFLIDVSTSIRANSRVTIEELMLGLIENKDPGDAFSIATFGEEIRVLQDFSTDRWELAKAFEQVAYTDQESSIFEAVQQMAASMRGDAREAPAFLQMVVLSDGVEQSQAGIIKEELFFDLRGNPLPVHTLGFQYENNADGLKELYAVSRITGATSHEIGGEAEASQLAEELELFTSGILWVQAVLPREVQDGSVRQIDIVYTGSAGEAKIQYDMKMPLAQVESAPSQPEHPAALTIVPAAEAAAESTAGASFFAQLDDLLPEWRPIAGIGLALILAGIATAVVIKKRKNRPKLKWKETEEPVPVLAPADNTRMLDDNGGTQYLIPQQATREEGVTKVVLIDLRQAHRRFEAPVGEGLVIGREEGCGIVIDYERSVSRQHCRIYEKNGRLWIEDLGSSNKTRLNDIPVTEPQPLKDNATLTLGKAQFSVTFQIFR